MTTDIFFWLVVGLSVETIIITVSVVVIMVRRRRREK